MAPPESDDALAELSRVAAGAWTIARKDLASEWRSKEILLTMGFFGFLVVFIFAFAFFRGDAPLAPVGAGALWVAIAFSGTLGLHRAFEREKEGDCLRALLLSPVPRPSIFIGKLIGISAFMLVVELIVTPAVVLFFSLSIDPTQALELAGVLLLGTLGYATVGTVLAASLVRAQSRDVLLAIAVYPIVIPVIVGGVKATATILAPDIDAGEALAIWVKLLLVFDVVFVVVSLWIFEWMLLD
jgi:heme exporter protein CcmB